MFHYKLNLLIVNEIKTKMKLSPFNGCNFKFIDRGAFRCKEAYVKIFSENNQQLTLTEQQSSSGFDYEQFIPRDFCMGGIEIGYDISWGMDWPIKQRFFHVINSRKSPRLRSCIRGFAYLSQRL